MPMIRRAARRRLVKSGPGRPTVPEEDKGEVVHARVDQKTSIRLHEIMEEKRWPLSEVVRAALDDYIARLEKTA